MIDIQLLSPADASQFRDLRLRGLQESPTAFGASYAQEAALSLSDFEKRLEVTADRWILGAKVEGSLVAVIGFGREVADKSRHRGYIWGMYVDLGRRGEGIGRTLLKSALSKIDSITGLRSVKLGVTASNSAAIHLYESFGFVRFGLEPEYLFVEDAYHSMLLMSRPVPNQLSSPTLSSGTSRAEHESHLRSRG